ncbi:MAG: DUF5060 domain-containing protein [Oligoflexus sp.]
MRGGIHYLLLALSICFSSSAIATVLDSFETNEHLWEVKEWGDRVAIKTISDQASHGKRGLKISFTEDQRVEDKNKGAFLRRPLDGSIGERKAIIFDLYNPMKSKVNIAIGLDADEYYESATLELKPGWNRNLKFSLSDPTFKANASRWENRLKMDQGLFLGSIYVIFYFHDAKEGHVVLDHVRTEGQTAAKTRSMTHVAPDIKKAPRLTSIMGKDEAIEQYGLFERTIHFDALYHNPYDGKEIAVRAKFVSPSKKTYDVSGFLESGDVTLSEAVENPIWKLRFTPRETGLWSYHFELQNPVGTVKSKTYRFKVNPSKEPGFLQVDPDDRNYFSFESGQFYYPIGQNLGWDSLENYEAYFKQMAENGQNWARIWMSHWSFGLEWKPMGHYRGLGNYNLRNAARLDQLFTLAKRHGIYLQLVFDFHGAFSSHVNPEWHNNPYNVVNGGFLEKAHQFFTSEKAKELYRQRLRYIIARWGHSTHLMAWEFFNEINFSDDFNPENDTAWHKEMAAWLKQSDPYQHMITTSYYDYINRETYALDDIDFTQYHMYKQRAYRLIGDLVPRLAAFNKPHFVAEFGSDSRDGEDDKDKSGIFLHAGLWSQLMQPASGNAMPWWWNSHIHPNNLYFHFRAVAQFITGYDPRGENRQRVRMRQQVSENDNNWLEILGLKGDDKSWYWICDSKGKHFTKRSEPLEFNKVEVELGDYSTGRYKIEFWDTYRGEVREAKLIDHSRGKLKVTLPRFQNDLALKVKRVG